MEILYVVSHTWLGLDIAVAFDTLMWLTYSINILLFYLQIFVIQFLPGIWKENTTKSHLQVFIYMSLINWVMQGSTASFIF